MADQDTDKKDEGSSGGGTATQTKPDRKQQPKSPAPRQMPPWKVLLHNDDINTPKYVVETIVELTPLNKEDAFERMDEADKTGVSLLLTTHKERAELYQEQFQSKGLTVTIEPTE